ncbi:MAG: tetratricopeptide repeat protein, partial [Cytophagales bacterium]|nr:tetratricopeptide repeat protein [Cytophagales bacterium]
MKPFCKNLSRPPALENRDKYKRTNMQSKFKDILHYLISFSLCQQIHRMTPTHNPESHPMIANPYFLISFLTAKVLLSKFLAIVLCVAIFLPCLCAGQSAKVDSLTKALKTAKHACPEPCPGDTTRIKLLNALGWQLMYQNPDTAILLGKQALALAERLPRAGSPSSRVSGSRGEVFIAASHNNLGVYYWLKDDYPRSLSHHFKALEIRKQLSNSPDKAIAQSGKKGIAASLCNIGIVYDDQGDYPSALKHYFEALEIFKELGYESKIAAVLGNIGVVYWNQGDYPSALKHYFEALEIDKELGNKNG